MTTIEKLLVGSVLAFVAGWCLITLGIAYAAAAPRIVWLLSGGIFATLAGAIGVYVAIILEHNEKTPKKEGDD